MRSILMPGQPFAFAGDTTLTSVMGGKGEHYVSVDRLYGNQVNEFTMVNVNKEFPAHPPADTIALGASQDVRPHHCLFARPASSDLHGSNRALLVHHE